MKKLHCYALCALLLFYFNHSQAQCICTKREVNTTESGFGNVYVPDGTMLSQTFVPTCSGRLSSLTLPFTFADNNPDNIGINITLYRGNSPTDVKSSVLFQIINYKPRSNINTINVPLDVQLVASTNYYFTVSNAQGGNLPNQLAYTILPITVFPGGLWAWLNSTGGWVNYQYISRYNRKTYGNDMDYSLKVIPTDTISPFVINTDITTCLGNVAKIPNNNNNCMFLVNNTNNVFTTASNSNGDILIKTINYGTEFFYYAVGDNSPQIYKCNVTVMPNDPPTITASKQVFSSINDTATITAQASPNVALSFDGNTYLTVPYNKGFASSNVFTIEGWIMCNDVNNIEYIFSKGMDDMVLGQYGVLVNKGKIEFVSRYSSNAANGFYSAIPFVSNTWIHVAITNDGSTIRFYFNGEEIGKAGYSIATIDNQQDIQIGQLGKAGSLYRFKGQMDELRFWNVCRTADEIKNNYQKTVLGYSKGLVAYYKFDHSADSSVAIDASINYNNAYVNNGSAWVTGSLDIPKYTYLWNNNATKQNIVVTSPDTYSYKLTDLTTGCTTQSPEIQITVKSK